MMREQAAKSRRLLGKKPPGENVSREHVYEKHEECGRNYCPICDGGLLWCVVCKGGEGGLAEECPGISEDKKRDDQETNGDKNP